MQDWKRADMHLHTIHSGWRRLKWIGARDSYMTPEIAFAEARRRGMDFVCFTDHESIDGALEFLSRHPEEEERVIVGEEIEVRLPGASRWLHLGVYGIDESIHADLKRAGADLFDTVDYLRESGLLFALNHPFQSFRSIRSARRHLRDILPHFSVVEVCNSSSPRVHRRAVEALVAQSGARSCARLGGSDAHTPGRVAAAFTLAPGATKEDFLASIRRGECAIGGEALGFPQLLADLYRVIFQYYVGLYGPARSGAERRRVEHYLGSLLLLPGVILGVPALLATLHVARQEWIARLGAWEHDAPTRAEIPPAEGQAASVEVRVTRGRQ